MQEHGNYLQALSDIKYTDIHVFPRIKLFGPEYYAFGFMDVGTYA